MVNLMCQMNRAAKKPTGHRTRPAIGTEVSAVGRLKKVSGYGAAHAKLMFPGAALRLGFYN